MTDRLCAHCHAPLTRKPGERPSQFAPRKYCGHECSIRALIDRNRMPFVRAEVEALAAAGLTLDAMAFRLRVQPSTVSKYMARVGIVRKSLRGRNLR